MADYSVYISSCDGYSDCWEPFFTLLERFWPDCSHPLYLGSEYMDSPRPDRVTALALCKSHGVPSSERVPWSRFTRWALEAIPSPLVLFLQEDFFLKAPVKDEEVERITEMMEAHPEIACVHLTDQGPLAEGPSDEFPGMDVLKLKQRYRVSCQAALWRKDELLALLRDKESAWEYEEFGSARSAAMGHLYLGVSRKIVRLGEYEIIPYLFTGIVQGRWIKEVVSLFEANGIEVDYSRRGFDEDYPKRKKSNWKRFVGWWVHLSHKIENERYIRRHIKRLA